ncbi:hypothetical protein HQ585_01860 [candidate division KSB1 bacterium]|nr:hypothetical protein [candidate division KSB1 bacterium]
MQLYIYSNLSENDTQTQYDPLRDIIHRIAAQTDSSDLVVALYLWPGRFRTRGTAYVNRWMTPRRFLPTHGNWKAVRSFGVPADLPARFKLIRLRLDGNRSAYPKKELDIYGWEFQYPDFKTHLAHLFAHELHHFRRYHLGLHPREGEHSANQWALDHVRNLDYPLEYRRIQTSQQKKPSKKNTLWKKIVGDPFSHFRGLKQGDTVRIVNDPRKKYTRQEARVLRPIRTNSTRIVIQTMDGKEWRWPMNWLEPDVLTTKI